MTATARRPRFVVVTRRSPLDLLLERHGTLGQARFYLRSRGQDPAWAEAAHEGLHRGLAALDRAIPPDRRRARVDRDSLDRFLFAPDDVVLAVGQDGLVANVAKYLAGQPLAGINPDPGRNDGVLCRHRPAGAARLVAWLERAAGGGPPGGGFRFQRRTMVVAEREDGQRLLALNEIFAGHRSHQSARYLIRTRDGEEYQSSSGVICATGTGSTGWARSIARQRGLEARLPRPEEARLAWMVREPFPSVTTGVTLDYGELRPAESLELVSEMPEDGVVFGDGIESDSLELVAGQRLRIGLADRALHLVIPDELADYATLSNRVRLAPSRRPGAGPAVQSNRPIS
jgi:hypothetical protein